MDEILLCQKNASIEDALGGIAVCSYYLNEG